MAKPSNSWFHRLVIACLVFPALLANDLRAADEFPSWNDGATKTAIITFVERVTKKDSPDFVPPTERIATFDNDGTLWAEQPMYFQFFFALDRVKVLAPQHPESLTVPTLAASGERHVVSQCKGHGNAIESIVWRK